VGKLLLAWRLAVKDLRYHFAEAVLLLLAVTAAAAAVTLGLALHGVTNAPYDRTRAATSGSDVVAHLLPADPNPGAHAPASEARQFDHAAGVIAHSGSFPVTWAPLRAGSITAGAEIEGRDSAAAPVDQPKLTSGSWARPGGVVIEAGFAEALGLHVGDRLRLAGIPFQVAGTAVTAAVPAYPEVCYLSCDFSVNGPAGSPGLVWLTTADTALAARTANQPVTYFLNLKLADPADAAAFADRYDAATANTPDAPYLISWQDISNEDAKTTGIVQLILLTGSGLLVLLALASVAVLVGGRMAEQSRRVGLMKAVGGTPVLVAAVLMLEHVIIGVIAAGTGLLAGWLTAPLLDGPGAGLLGTAGTPALGLGSIGAVLALALGIAIAATFVPALRAARTSTVRLLDDAARAPRRNSLAIRLSARLPAPLLVGARLSARRPRRLVLATASAAITASGIMAVMVVHATNAANSPLTPNDPRNLRLDQVTTVLSVMLTILAAANAVFIAWAATLDTRHSSALARALGATPGQITAGISVAQILPALAGALLGIPGGIGIYDAVKNAGTPVIPAAGWVAAMVLGTVLAAAILTAIPARIGARQPVAEVLQAESA
jgi:ABC-type antimicrobial peptide transport system permease subunit